MQLIDVDDLCEKKTKKVNSMYHYTSSDGLLGIIGNDSLRFTDCFFLNDTEEFNYIFNVLEKCFENEADVEYKRFLNKVANKLSSFNEGSFFAESDSGFPSLEYKVGQFYVLCGSTDSDSLPMWNYYVKDGNYTGYNIELRIDELLLALKQEKNDIFYGTITYDLQDQIQIIENKVREIIANKQRELDSYYDDGFGDDYIEEKSEDYEIELLNFLKSIRLFFKAEGFSHEHEFRVAVLTDNKNECFTSQKGLIKPFKTYKGISKAISGITLSPTIESDIGTVGVAKFIGNKLGYKALNKIEIKRSELKIRF